MRIYKDKEIVYVNSVWNVAEKCEITGYIEHESSTGQAVYKVHSIEFCGTFGATIECIFRTRKEAIEAYQKEQQKIKEAYKKEIASLEDLLKFPLDNCIEGCEYTDYAARQAYIERAEELTQLKI